MAAAGVFVDMGVQTPTGSPLREAMAAGLACVVPAAAAAWDFVSPGVTAVVADRGIAASVAAVSALVTDHRSQRQIGVAAAQELRRHAPARAALGLLGALEAGGSLQRTPRPPAAPQLPLQRGGWNDVTVVIAVYNAYEEVLRCVDSVLRCTAGDYRVLLVNDGSPDPRVEPALRDYARRHSAVQVLSRADNRGYTATVNEACRFVGGDVVLLNSDTEVTPGWLASLQSVAASRPDVATVTPLSNAAGAFSVPAQNVDSDLPPRDRRPHDGRIGQPAVLAPTARGTHRQRVLYVHPP